MQVYMFKKLIFVFSSWISFGMPAQQVMDWGSLPQEVNDKVYSLTNYNGKMVAAGAFTKAGNTSFSQIAAWDGSNWSGFGKGIRGNYVFRTYVFNNELYAVGDFDSAGTIATKNIAKWDGTAWSGFGTGANSIVYALAMYNGKLYAAGDFTSISGTAANYIAKWDGTSWQPLGTGLQSTVYGALELHIHQNQLFVSGTITNAGSLTVNGCARWNDTVWKAAPMAISRNPLAMCDWNSKLLMAGDLPPYNTSEVLQWVDSLWTTFIPQTPFNIRTMFVNGSKLYGSGGGLLTTGYSTVTEWDSLAGQWTILGSGITDYTRGLCLYNGELYCGGFFNVANGAYHNYITKYGITTGIMANELNQVEVNVSPNPFTNKIKISVSGGRDQIERIEILNTLGVSIYSTKNGAKSTDVDLEFLMPGVYYLDIGSSAGGKTIKIIKQ